MINHKPCFTDDDIALRLMQDHKEIKQMINEGHKVIAKVNYHSETTLETHCLPVFNSDTIEDLANRYFDFFPKECRQTIKAIEDESKILYHSNGMSKDGIIKKTLHHSQRSLVDDN